MVQNLHSMPEYQLLQALSELNTKIRRFEQECFPDHEKQQLLLLPLIHSHATAPTVAELAEMNGTSPEETARMLEGLEHAGYLTQSAKGGKGAPARVSITDKGIQACNTCCATLYQDIITNLYKDIDSEEIEQTLAVVKALYGRLAAIEEV